MKISIFHYKLEDIKLSSLKSNNKFIKSIMYFLSKDRSIKFMNPSSEGGEGFQNSVSDNDETSKFNRKTYNGQPVSTNKEYIRLKELNRKSYHGQPVSTLEEYNKLKREEAYRTGEQIPREEYHRLKREESNILENEEREAGKVRKRALSKKGLTKEEVNKLKEERMEASIIRKDIIEKRVRERWYRAINQLNDTSSSFSNNSLFNSNNSVSIIEPAKPVEVEPRVYVASPLVNYIDKTYLNSNSNTNSNYTKNNTNNNSSSSSALSSVSLGNPGREGL